MSLWTTYLAFGCSALLVSKESAHKDKSQPDVSWSRLLWLG